MSRPGPLTWLREVLHRFVGAFRRDRRDADLARELELHLEMAEEDLRRKGHPPAEARRLARVRHGKTTQALESMRDQRGLPKLESFGLDLKLAVRMLRRSWGLTLAGGLAMTTAIGIGAVVFDVLQTVTGQHLPLDDGDRVIAIQTWDAADYARRPNAPEDFERWRDSVASLVEVGAFRSVERNLILEDTPPEIVVVAEMSAAGFRVARTPPMLGRALTPEDERPGAPPVVVLGHSTWRARFDSDPDVLGRQIRLGRSTHTVVGVMPEGFAFPMNHRYWTALPRNLRAPIPTGGAGAVFGRLAPGATMEGAQAELEALGLVGSDRDEPSGKEGPEPRLAAYAINLVGDFTPWMIRIILGLMALLLVPPSVNVAILVYARTITRQQELATRYALGASRARVTGQLFLEVLVLASLAGCAALGIARLAMWRLKDLLDSSLGGDVPFWMDFGLSTRTVLFVTGLCLIAAVIAGLAPAVQATGRTMQAGLRSLGSRTAPRLGRLWATFVVIQVGLAVCALPTAIELAWGTLRPTTLGPGFAADEYLTATLVLDPSDASVPTAEGDGLGEYARLRNEVVRRLRDEPDVSAVTFASGAPGDEPWRPVEIEAAEGPRAGLEEAREPPVEDRSSVRLVRSVEVDESYFETFDLPMLLGRPLGPEDRATGSFPVVVSHTLAQQIAGDRNPLGRRMRYLPTGSEPRQSAAEPGPWHEIVGVVPDLPAHREAGRMFHLAGPATRPAVLLLHLRPSAERAPGRLREIAVSLDPALKVEAILGLDEIYREHARGNNLGALTLAAVTLSVLLLCAGGVYALVAFTVQQRRREIGIRAALGARPRQVISAILYRALRQVLVGASVGLALAAVLEYYVPAAELGGFDLPGILPATALFMTCVGLLASLGPARRALAVEPTEALREG